MTCDVCDYNVPNVKDIILAILLREDYHVSILDNGEEEVIPIQH